MRLKPVSNLQKFEGNLYNNKILKKGLEFASDNTALFCAATSLALGCAARSAAILLTPDTDKENKKYAAAKSISSGATGFLLTFLIATPFSNAIKNIDKNPSKYLSKETIKNLQKDAPNLNVSKNYKFATQLFKLGLGLLIAIPKSNITSFLIPKVMKLFPKKEENKTNKDISFKGNLYNKAIEKLSYPISDLINTKTVQKMSDKFSNGNFERNMMFLTDIVLTGAFINKTKKNKKIEEKRKKPLIYNSVLSTAFSIISTFTIDKLINKKFQIFVEKFIEVNKNSSKLDKYITGLNIAKTSIIMALSYYIIIPVISTFLSDKIDKKHS